jgi:autotransporter-associated beta strand protein
LAGIKKRPPDKNEEVAFPEYQPSKIKRRRCARELTPAIVPRQDFGFLFLFLSRRCFMSLFRLQARTIFGCGVISLSMIFLAVPSVRANLIWDTNTGTAGVQEGPTTAFAQTWDSLGNTNWMSGSTNVQWNNGAPDVAQFGDTFSATGYSVGVASMGITATGVNFKRGYTLGDTAVGGQCGNLTLTGVAAGDVTTATIATLDPGSGTWTNLQPKINSNIVTTADVTVIGGYAVYDATHSKYSQISLNGTANDFGGGALQITGGFVNMTNFGNVGEIQVATGGSLKISPATPPADPTTYSIPTTHLNGLAVLGNNGAMDSGRGALLLGHAIWAGDIVLDTDSSIAASGASNITQIDGVISGGGKLVKTGTGNLILTNNNLYTGNTEIVRAGLTLNAATGPAIKGNVTFNASSSDTGVLNFLADNQLESTALVTFSRDVANQSINLQGTAQTVAGIINAVATTDSRSVIQNNKADSTATLTVNVPEGGTPSYRGIIRNTSSATTYPNSVLAVIKDGSGVWTIDGANCGLFTGGLTVAEGTLVLGANGPTSFSSPTLLVQEDGTLNVSAKSGFTVAGGQTLKGNGSILGAVVAAASSSIEPGESIGTLTVTGDVTVNGGFDVEYDSNTNEIDELAVTGNLDLTNATITFPDLGTGTLAPGTYVFASCTGAFTAPTTLPTAPEGSTIDWAYNGGKGAALIVIPEPSTLILLALAGLTLAGFRRRR